MNFHEIHQTQYEKVVTEANFRIDKLFKTIDDKKKIIKIKKTISFFIKSKIRDLKKKLAKKSRNTVKTDEKNSDRKSNYVLAKSTAMKIKKTIIFSDPDKFIDEKKPWIDSWALKIKNKLCANASLFSNEKVRIGYVQNLIDEQAFRRLESRFREDSRSLYLSADVIVEDLRRIYNDSNRRLTTINVLRELRIKNNNFIDFWAKF